VFHAWQSIIVSVIYIIGAIILAIIGAATGFGWLIYLWWLPFFVLWIICMYFAYRYAPTQHLWKIPLIGSFAEGRAIATSGVTQ